MNKTVSKKNIIVLNGKHYDSTSGIVVAHPAADVKKSSPAQPRMVDSFVHAPGVITKVPHKVSPSSLKPVRAVAQSVTSTPQRAQTLMRSAVKKPTGLASPTVKTQIPITVEEDTHVAVRTQTSLHKIASQTVDQSRLARSHTVVKPAGITRFKHSNESSFVPPTPITQPPTKSYYSVPAPVTAPSPPVTKLSKELFEQAMKRSTSHQETYNGPVNIKTRRKQHFGFATLVVAVLLLAGFVTYLNAPNLTMTLASARAGFHASIPAYVPAGYSVKHLAYTEGTVSTDYASNSDNSSFTIMQKNSDWDSSALLTNFVTITNQSYQTYQVSGRNVYLYGNNSATWVDGGVWYTVTGNGALSNKQLLDIASGL